ncbi:MAG: DnaJ domain-containing protein [bacterium]|nr:MAG: DnaJ domain-containing protein [bacterium]
MKDHCDHMEVVEAFRTLFGPGLEITDRFLSSLHIVKLREAYRRKALELHPDRASLLGLSESELTERFKDVGQAYHRITDFLSRGGHLRMSVNGQRFAGGTVGSEDPSSGHFDHYWRGSLPRRELLLGQFLYYSGNISWGSLVKSIAWQRDQRPSFGRITRMWSYLAGDQVSEVLCRRSMGERFGESAVRLGYLNSFQRNAVLGFQRWLQRPIGEYFVEKEILSPASLSEIVHCLRRHNSFAKQGWR